MKLRILFLFFVFVFTACEPSNTESVIKGSRTFVGFFESAIDCYGEFVDGEPVRPICSASLLPEQ